METCETCQYFDSLVGGIGKCRRYAPRQTLALADGCFAWPAVKQEDWCGDYKPVEEEDVNAEYYKQLENTAASIY